MKSEWKNSVLGDLVEIKYGKDYKSVIDENGNIPIYGTGGVMGYANRSIYNKPSVLIGRKGSISRVKFVDSPFWTVDTLFYTVINDLKVLPKFLFYELSLINFDYYNEGTTIPSLRTETLNRLEITLPPLPTQKKIAAILSALDAKIENNNAINRNLEQQAQALFKSWFVDFESFGGNMPEGWREESIYSVAKIVYGAPFKSSLFNLEKEGRPIVRIRDLKGQNLTTYTTEILEKEYIIKPGDIVVGMDGEFRPYIWGNDNALLNQRVCVFKPNSVESSFFVYFTILPQLDFIERTEAATTVIHIGKSDFDTFLSVIPESSIMNNFNKLTYPMYEMIVKNQIENTRLAALRDTLLPKLMSGEIEV